jgi:hypothetical protein
MTVDYTHIRTHRADGWGARAARRIAAVVLILATLALARVISQHTPDAISIKLPFVRVGAIGSVVDARRFDVDVLGVRGAAVVSDGEDNHDTSGVWILVKARFTAIRNPTMIGYTVLVDGDGRTYRASSRMDQPVVSGRYLEPGMPVTVEIAFEVPVAVATDLSVEFAEPLDVPDLRMEAVAEVHLPIDRSEVTSWTKSTKPALLATMTEGA